MNKNAEAFEKKFTYIAAGAVALALTFLSVLGGSRNMFLFLSGICLLVFALLMNLSAYYFHNRIWKELSSNIYYNIVEKKCLPEIRSTQEMVRINKKVNTYNLWNLIIMMAGIVLVILFVLCNYQNVGNEKTAGQTMEQTEVTR